MTLRQRLADLTFQNEALMRSVGHLIDQATEGELDKERLDWLDRDDVVIECGLRDGKAWVWIVPSSRHGLVAEGPTLRDAVDNAMASASAHAAASMQTAEAPMPADGGKATAP